GRLQPELEPVDLPTETVEVASMFRSAIEAGGVKLVIDCDGLDRPVLIDRRMWEQIVTNLISNAFKHTLEGRIDVALRGAEEHVELRISDTGEGIPEPELPRIFERFHRVESTRARTIEGSGIGLALVRELVELHHGTISVESRLGEGTS